MKPSKLLVDLGALDIPQDRIRDCLYLVMFLAARAEPGTTATVTASSLVKALKPLAWDVIADLLASLADEGLITFRADPKRKKKVKGTVRDIFGNVHEEVHFVHVHLSKFRYWFGNEPKKKKNAFDTAVDRQLAKMKMEGANDEAARPTSEKVVRMWQWWGEKFRAVTEQIHGKPMRYQAERSFTQDVGYLAEMATMDSEVVWRAAKAVLKGETRHWMDGKRTWWLGGQRTVRAWLEASKFLLHRTQELMHRRMTGIMEEIYGFFWDGDIDYGAAKQLMDIVETAGVYQAVEAAREMYGIRLSPQEAGLRGVRLVEGERPNGVVREQPKQIEAPSLWDLSDVDDEGNRRLAGETDVNYKDTDKLLGPGG